MIKYKQTNRKSGILRIAMLAVILHSNTTKAMEQFKIRKDGFNEIRKSMLLKASPILLLTTIAGFAINNLNSQGEQNDINILPFTSLMVLGIFAFGLYRGVNKQKEILDSYELMLDSDGITRKQHNTPTITIANSDLSEIIKNPNGSFTIKGNSPINVMIVPAQIDNYDILEKLLAERSAISIKTSEPFLQKFSGLVTILIIGMMAAVYISKDKIIVGITGTLLLAGFGYSFIEVRRSKNLDNKTKKGIWWLLLVMASIVGIMYSKLVGQQ